jgi:hypothetical protein
MTSRHVSADIPVFEVESKAYSSVNEVHQEIEKEKGGI